MKLEFSNEDLVMVLTEHLKNQGMNMKNKTLTVNSKSKYLGKGLGNKVTVIAEVYETKPNNVQEEDKTLQEELELTGVIFGDDEL